jgi:hypothetical protein
MNINKTCNEMYSLFNEWKEMTLCLLI